MAEDSQNKEGTELPRTGGGKLCVRQIWIPSMVIAVVVYMSAAAFQIQTPLQFSVLSVFVFIGFVAFIEAMRGILSERHAFEESRKKELAPDTVARLVAQYPSAPEKRAADAVFSELLKSGESAGGGDTRWHHCERLRHIISAAFPEGEAQGHLPSLSNLRMLAAAAELNRRSAWILKSIASTLLIVGIWGTLYGVHQALPTDANERIDLLQVRAALMPSAVAVSFTILFAILRGVYMHAVTRHLARLDHHTLRLYFPLFRSGSSDEIRYKELGKHVADLNVSLAEISKSVESICHAGPRLMRARKGLIPHDELLALSKRVETSPHAPAEFVELGKKMQEQIGGLEKQYLEISEQVSELGRLLAEAASQVAQGAAMSATTQEHLCAISDGWSHIPAVLQHHQMDVEYLLRIQESVNEAMPRLGRIKMAVECLNSTQGEIVDQARTSVHAADHISSCLGQLQISLESDRRLYDEYQKNLESCYARGGATMQDLAPKVQKWTGALGEMSRLLRKRESGTKQEFLSWWEILVVSAVAVLCVVNVCASLLTFS